MDDLERTILLEIDELKSKLFNFSNGKCDGINYQNATDDLFDKIKTLYHSFKPLYLSGDSLENIYLKCKNAGNYAVSQCKKANYKYDTRLYTDISDNATEPLIFSIYLILEEINKIKNNNLTYYEGTINIIP